ncbi:MAG: hypothetical protein ACTHJM_08965 [Marmoricola sp.]
MAVIVILTGGSAVAQTGPVGLSLDGVHWSSALPHPLFTSSYRWVPGDTQAATLYVRNQSGKAAVLTVAMVSGALRDAVLNGDFLVSTSVDGRKATAAHPPASQVIVAVGPAAAGTVHRIRIVVTMSRSATNQAQSRRFSFNFKVTLSQAPTSLGGGVHPGHVTLPDTGSPMTPSLLLATALLLTTGATLMWRSRRTTNTNERRP